LGIVKEMVNHCLQGNLYRRAKEPIAVFEDPGALAAQEIDLSSLAAGESVGLLVKPRSKVKTLSKAPLVAGVPSLP
jgi:hypothetical protein